MSNTLDIQCRTLSVEQVAEILGISRASGYTLVKGAVTTKEPFSAVRIGGQFRVSLKSFTDYLQENDL